jgi:DNA-binding transcriptional MerR regulator
VTDRVAERSHLSIGEVLSLLREEFPDVTISKIRFLESQGLLDPERTPSGYRKFYDDDIERLRWILRQQREHFLPLKVIKGRLLEGNNEDSNGDSLPRERSGEGLFDGTATSPSTAGGLASPAAVTPGAGPAGAGAAGSATGGSGTVGSGPGSVGPDDAGGGRGGPTGSSSGSTGGSTGGSAAGDDPWIPPVAGGSSGPGRVPTRAAPAAASTGPTPMLTSPVPPVNGTAEEPGNRPGPRSTTMTLEELAAATGLDQEHVRDLERFGLLTSRDMGGTAYFDAEGLEVARLAAGFARHGVEARHLRMYKNAAERETGLFEQVVMPLFKQRNPQARRQAMGTIDELSRLGADLREVLLRAALRDTF